MDEAIINNERVKTAVKEARRGIQSIYDVALQYNVPIEILSLLMGTDTIPTTKKSPLTFKEENEIVNLIIQRSQMKIPPDLQELKILLRTMTMGKKDKDKQFSKDGPKRKFMSRFFNRYANRIHMNKDGQIVEGHCETRFLKAHLLTTETSNGQSNGQSSTKNQSLSIYPPKKTKDKSIPSDINPNNNPNINTIKPARLSNFFRPCKLSKSSSLSSNSAIPSPKRQVDEIAYFKEEHGIIRGLLELANRNIPMQMDHLEIFLKMHSNVLYKEDQIPTSSKKMISSFMQRHSQWILLQDQVVQSSPCIQNRQLEDLFQAHECNLSMAKQLIQHQKQMLVSKSEKTHQKEVHIADSETKKKSPKGVSSTKKRKIVHKTIIEPSEGNIPSVESADNSDGSSHTIKLLSDPIPTKDKRSSKQSPTLRRTVIIKKSKPKRKAKETLSIKEPLVFHPNEEYGLIFGIIERAHMGCPPHLDEVYQFVQTLVGPQNNLSKKEYDEWIQPFLKRHEKYVYLQPNNQRIISQTGMNLNQVAKQMGLKPCPSLKQYFKTCAVNRNPEFQ